MINKNFLISLVLLIFLGACTAPTAMLGPAYTFSTTGNIYHTGFSYGSNEIVTRYTGKTPIENLKKISSLEIEKKQNIKRKTIESEEFHNLVKKRIKKTRDIINLPIQ
mgnify:FL=1